MKPCGNDASNPSVLLPMAPQTTCSASDNAGSLRPPRLDQKFVTGSVEGPGGRIPQVSSGLTKSDRWGSMKARWGIGRMTYTVDPGLYALGTPDEHSPVLVTANYKMSFDRLREALPGRHLWILVVDTKGINVWCAAGKGTFGTDELLRRIAATKLKDVVKHRDLILPQLGAPGVAGYLIKKQSGFTVHYGPILARHVAAYLDAGLRATADMRRKAFPMKERAVLIPMELVATLKPVLIIVPLLLCISSFGVEGGFIRNLLHEGMFSVAAFVCAIVSGAILTPLLLPYLPGRAFATKGIVMGLVVAVVFLTAWSIDLHSGQGLIQAGAWFMLIPAISAYLAMNFTGSSTYTSLSGVKKEMRWALPLEIGVGISGFTVLLVSRFF